MEENVWCLGVEMDAFKSVDFPPTFFYTPPNSSCSSLSLFFSKNIKTPTSKKILFLKYSWVSSFLYSWCWTSKLIDIIFFTIFLPTMPVLQLLPTITCGITRPVPNINRGISHFPLRDVLFLGSLQSSYLDNKMLGGEILIPLKRHLKTMKSKPVPDFPREVIRQVVLSCRHEPRHLFLSPVCESRLPLLSLASSLLSFQESIQRREKFYHSKGFCEVLFFISGSCEVSLPSLPSFARGISR